MSLDLNLVHDSQSNPGQARTSACFQSQRMNAALPPGKPGNITPDTITVPFNGPVTADTGCVSEYRLVATDSLWSAFLPKLSKHLQRLNPKFDFI